MIGGPGLSTYQKREPNGAPIALGALNNGISVDPLTAIGVLGQAVGEAGDPAQLLSFREIPMAGQQFTLKGDLHFGVLQEEIRFFSGYMTMAGAYLASFGPGITLNNLNGGQIVNIGFVDDGGGNMFFSINDGNTFLKLDNGTGQFWVTQAPNDGPPGVGAFSVIGSLAALGNQGYIIGKRNVVQVSATPEIFTDDFSRSIYTNDALANSDVDLTAGGLGSEAMGVVVQAGTVTLTPAPADTITIGGTTGAAGAPATSNVVGSVIKLIRLNSGWFAESVVGTWTV